jgi:hypothetical protein
MKEFRVIDHVRHGRFPARRHVDNHGCNTAKECSFICYTHALKNIEDLYLQFMIAHLNKMEYFKNVSYLK